jgi:hypothetical protein
MRRMLVVSAFLLIALSADARTKLQGYSGHPSCTVTVYLTGTASTATIYADAASSSKSNSFTAAADGFYFFYVDNGSYDIQFSGSGFTTFSWTDIRVAEGGVTSLVTTFGAKCDGTTDDTAAIQRAIDIATPNKVQLPTGTCKITDELLISQHRVTIEGTGPDASWLQFAPTTDGKAAIKVDLAAATVISLTRLKGFSIHTTDTTHLKIGIDIVDGSETIVEDIAIGTQDAWYGGTNVSPFTGTGSIGIRLQGREFGTFRNVRSCGAIPLYIANNPNFASIDIDHHKFDGFYFEPHGNNPSVYVEDDVNLSNVTFENGGWVLGGAGFYWPDTSSTGSSYNLVFRNIRPEQFSSAGYVFYITKNAPLQGLRIEDVVAGSGTNNKGVYLRGVTQTVFDVFNYFGTLECLNTDGAFDWRSSICQSNSTVNFVSPLTEVWAETMIDGLSPMPQNGRYQTAPGSSNFDAGVVRRFMGVYQLAKTGSLTSGSTVQIPSRYGSIVLGRISIVFKGATKSGSFTVAVTSAGAAVESTTDATITGVGNVANKITVHYSSASSIVIRNNLSETVTYSYSYFWN